MKFLQNRKSAHPQIVSVNKKIERSSNTNTAHRTSKLNVMMLSNEGGQLFTLYDINERQLDLLSNSFDKYEGYFEDFLEENRVRFEYADTTIDMVIEI